MTSPVTPPAAPTVPIYPPLGSPTFNADAYAYGAGMPGVVSGIEALAQNSFINATSAEVSAVSAQASAAAGDASASVAMASSHFKGEWYGLAGAIAMPASVAHAGRFWLLLADLPDVTAAVPGVSASWLAFDIALPVIPVTTATFTAVSGKHYSLEYMAGPVTGTMPPYSEGAMVWVTVANDRYDNVLMRNDVADSFMGIPDDLTLVQPTTYAFRGIKNSWRGL